MCKAVQGGVSVEAQARRFLACWKGRLHTQKMKEDRRGGGRADCHLKSGYTQLRYVKNGMFPLVQYTFAQSCYLSE